MSGWLQIVKVDEKKFDPSKLERLNNPERLRIQDPNLLWQTVDVEDPEVLVDIGAGTGIFDARFAPLMGDGRIYACDISDTMLAYMEANLPADVRNVVVPTKMEESAVPLAEGIADLVFLIDVYHELQNPPAILSEADRLLKPGGKVMVVDWKQQETPMGPPLFHRVALEQILLEVGAVGFADLEVHDLLPYHYFVVGTKIRGRSRAVQSTGDPGQEVP